MSEQTTTQGTDRKNEQGQTEKSASSQEETQEEESVMFFKQQVEDLEKKVDALISRTPILLCHTE